MTRLYIAGPMTGLTNYNFAAFAEAAARLRRQGFDVISPAEHDEDAGWVVVTRDSWGGIMSAQNREAGAFDWNTALDWDLDAIDQCDGIYLLPGWTKSRGATKEYEHAFRSGKVILGARAESTALAVTHQPLVGLVGYAQSGKDTFAAALGYRRLAFADPLKALSVACGPRFTVPDWGHNDEDSHAYPLSFIVAEDGWEYAKANVPGVREFLQDLGVGVRDILGGDTWVKAAFANYDPTQPTVITDVRFPNEIEAIKGRGGVIVRIDRPGVGPANGHVSEFAWQATTPYWQVHNGGSLESLTARARDLDTALRAGTL